MILIFAVFIVLVIFAVALLAGTASSGKRPQPNYALLNKRYSYRREPHADQITAYPNRLKDNYTTDL